MTESVIAPFTEDERAVLEICANGGSIAPIGRWEQPVHTLHRRGLLERQDQFNFTISELGRVASKTQEAEDDKAIAAFIEKGSANMRTQGQMAEVVSRMADLTVKLARDSAAVTGDSPMIAAEKWNAVMMARVREILGGS